MAKKTTAQLVAFDEAVLATGAKFVVGIDEVGRGSLIGPVVAGAVVFFPETFPQTLCQELQTLNDSKQLTAAVRESVYDRLPQMAWCAVAEASLAEIERMNIYHASLLAFHRAYEGVLAQLPEALRTRPHRVLLDGNAYCPYMPRAIQQTVVKGDGTSAHIAAASILAKVSRDRWAIEASANYPDYGWGNNMGYGTPEHLAALQRLGPTPLHRKQFKSVQTAQLQLAF